MRIAIASFGSGGDLFPLIPVARALSADGHEVHFIVSRSLGLYTRSLGMPSVSFGDGQEFRVFNDSSLCTVRFDGWSSWKQLLERYITPTLDDDLATLAEVFSRLDPEIVVTTSFAVAARMTARAQSRSHVSCSIYPQHIGLRRHMRANFPHRLIDAIRHSGYAGSLTSREVLDLAWGCTHPMVLMHDGALLRPAGGLYETECVELARGFPYWDDIPVSQTELSTALDWLADDDDPIVVVTLGSFLGLRATEKWHAAVTAVVDQGARALLLGASTARLRLDGYDPRRVKATAFLPLSQIVRQAAVVVHHGGVGTTFGTLRAGVPAVVDAQAFDQPYSATLIERAGAGYDAANWGVGPALRDALVNPEPTRRARLIAAELVDPNRAARAAADQIVALAVDA